MKVKDLLSMLKQMDPETRIMVDGYELGYDDLKSDNIRFKMVILNEWPEDSTCGPHDEYYGMTHQKCIESDDGERKEVVHAWILGRH